MAAGRDLRRFVSLALGVAVGAPTSLVPHAAKSLLRAASTTFTGGLANPIISVLEDLMAVALFVLTVLIPVVVAAFLVLIALLVVRRLARRSSAPLVTA